MLSYSFHKLLFIIETMCNVTYHTVYIFTAVSSSVLEGETLAMGMWSLGLGAVGAAIAGLILANTDFLLTKSPPATVEYLGNADLKTIDSGRK